MKLIPYISDTTVVDQVLIARLNPAPGDLIVICSRNLTIVSLLPDCNYFFAAGTFAIQGNLPLAVNATINNPIPAITILADTINGSLTVTSVGMPGDPGKEGKQGRPAIGGEPGTPGEPGEKGGPGSDGKPGGAITICYNTATVPPTATSTGGAGGPGGPGGPGGIGIPVRGGGWLPPSRRGPTGDAGHTGASGPVSVTKVSSAHIWDKLDASIAKQWSAYRQEHGTYLFRKYDTDSLKSAIIELKAAIQLDATNTTAQRMLQQIIQQQTPSGRSRYFDVTLDYPELAKNSSSGASFLQGFFTAFQNTADTATLSNNMLNQLNLTKTQLQGQLQYAAEKTIAAQQSLTITKEQAAQLANQITALKDSMNSGGIFSTLGSIASTVGAVGGALVSIATGVGAIVSVPEAIMAVGEDISSADSFLDFLTQKQNTDDLSSLGKDLGGILTVGSGFVNLTKIISQLKNATQDDSGGSLGKLGELVKEKKIADLEVAQATTELQAAKVLTDSLNTALQMATSLQNEWQADVNALNNAANVMIKLARLVADKVADDIFISARALEIYQLQPSMNLRFDYGYLNPDMDNQAAPAIRAALCQNTLGNMVNDILSSAELYNSLNVAEIGGYDVVHFSMSKVIDDPAQLIGFTTNKGISFSTINATGLPGGVTEMKVMQVKVAFTGPEPALPVNVWIEHSGHWIMHPRINGNVVEFNLSPRKEIISCKLNEGLLTGQIPNGQVLPGQIPFSFWGRGAMADWSLYVDAGNYDVFKTLNKIELEFYCAGFAPAGWHKDQVDTVMNATFQIN